MTGQLINSHDFSEYIYHIGCAINLHSIMNSGLIQGGQNLSKRQTVFFLLVDPMDKEHRDPDTMNKEHKDLRLSTCKHRVLHDTCRQHGKTSKHGVLDRYQTCSKESIKVLSDAIERHHRLQYTPSLLYPEGYQDGNWRNHIRESICVTPAASEDSL